MNNRKITAFSGCLLAAAILMTGCTSGAASTADPIPLEKGSIRASIASNGRIESDNSMKIYSSLGAEVEEIYVEVGDKVSAGDVLCRLDSSDINDDIVQQQAVIEASEIATEYKETTSEEAYRTAKERYESGLNQQLISAQTAIDTAEKSLSSAKVKLDDAKHLSESNLDSQIVSLEQAVVTAEREYNVVKKDFDKFMEDFRKLDYHEQEAQKTTRENRERSLESASINLSNAKDNLQAVKEGKSIELSQYEKAVTDATEALTKAKEDYSAAEKSVKLDITNLQAAAEREKIYSTNNTELVRLENLKKKLDETIITAPADGTVTAVLTEEGATGSGLMFVLEDTENLIVNASVKESNINKIKTGMEAVITSTATGDAKYSGTVTKIAPTTNKTASGDDAADGSFTVEITIDEPDGMLAVGMSAKTKIITSEKEDVFVVAFDAIGASKDGGSCIYEAIPAQTGSGYTHREIPVTIVSNSDTEAEISGEGLHEGMLIMPTAE